MLLPFPDPGWDGVFITPESAAGFFGGGFQGFQGGIFGVIYMSPGKSATDQCLAEISAVWQDDTGYRTAKFIELFYQHPNRTVFCQINCSFCGLFSIGLALFRAINPLQPHSFSFVAMHDDYGVTILNPYNSTTPISLGGVGVGKQVYC